MGGCSSKEVFSNATILFQFLKKNPDYATNCRQIELNHSAVVPKEKLLTTQQTAGR